MRSRCVNRDGQTPVRVPGFDPNPAFSPGMLTHDSLFISSLPGRAANGNIPADPAAEVTAALDSFKAVTEAAGLSLANVVFVNPYLTEAIPSRVMNKLYAERFEFGNTPARATISVVRASRREHHLHRCGGARSIETEGRAAEEYAPQSERRVPAFLPAIRCIAPPRAASSPARDRGSTRQRWSISCGKRMRNQLDNFEEADLDFSNVVAANVYLDNVDDFAKMNGVYAQYSRKA